MKAYGLTEKWAMTLMDCLGALVVASGKTIDIDEINEEIRDLFVELCDRYDIDTIVDNENEVEE